MAKKRKPRGRNWTMGERLVIYLMVREGESLAALNGALASHQAKEGLGPRTLPESSFSMMSKTYLPYLNDVNTLAELVRKPRSMGKLSPKRDAQAEANEGDKAQLSLNT
jgi:hypothetical protein